MLRDSPRVVENTRCDYCSQPKDCIQIPLRVSIDGEESKKTISVCPDCILWFEETFRDIVRKEVAEEVAEEARGKVKEAIQKALREESDISEDEQSNFLVYVVDEKWSSFFKRLNKISLKVQEESVRKLLELLGCEDESGAFAEEWIGIIDEDEESSEKTAFRESLLQTIVGQEVIHRVRVRIG